MARPRDLGPARYGRRKLVYRHDEERCDACREQRPCLGFDPSDDEYGPIWICKQCVCLALDERLTRIEGHHDDA